MIEFLKPAFFVLGVGLAFAAPFLALWGILVHENREVRKHFRLDD